MNSNIFKWATDKNIKNELGLLLVISQLSYNGYCWATNKYFAELFDETEVSISRKLKNLQKFGYIEIKYKNAGAIVKSREIRLTNLLMAVNKNVNGTVNKNVKDIYLNNNYLNNNNTVNKFVNGNVIDYTQFYANIKEERWK